MREPIQFNSPLILFMIIYVMGWRGAGRARWEGGSCFEWFVPPWGLSGGNNLSLAGII